MDLYHKNYIYVRGFLLLAIFLLFHYMYEWFPYVIFSIFSAVDESIFQHTKITFYSYIVLSVIEYSILKSKIKDKKKFLFSRLLSSIIILWILFILFLIGAIFYGERYFIVEIIYANIVLYLTTVSITIFEQEMISIEFSRRFKYVIVILFFLSVVSISIYHYSFSKSIIICLSGS